MTIFRSSQTKIPGSAGMTIFRSSQTKIPGSAGMTIFRSSQTKIPAFAGMTKRIGMKIVSSNFFEEIIINKLIKC